MKYIGILVKNYFKRVDYWISLFIYVLLMTVPTFDQYSLEGIDVPVYHFLTQNYRSAQAGVLLIMVANFPFASSIIKEVESNSLKYALLRADKRKYIFSHMVANTLACFILVFTAMIIATLFIRIYAPFNYENPIFLENTSRGVLCGEYLVSGQETIFYISLYLVYTFEALFYLWISMLLGMVFPNSLMVAVFPMMIYSFIKIVSRLVEIPVYLHPFDVFSRNEYFLKTEIPKLFLDTIGVKGYIVLYVVMISLLCYLLMVLIFDGVEKNRQRVRL